MPWVTEGRKTNPTSGTVLADTGPLPVGQTYSPQVVVSSTVALQAVLELRDADNTATVKSHTFLVAANVSFALQLAGSFDPWTEGERIRLIVGANITGTCQGSLFW